ncbi:MAG: hypothetical protein Q9226_007540 [Calogaya cf. arnoldii]
MQQAEKDLDIFWGHVENHRLEKDSQTVHQMFKEILTERRLQRTSDWVEPTDRNKDCKEHSETNTVSNELAALDFESRTDNKATAGYLYARERQIPETRGVPRTSSSATGQDTEDCNDQGSATRIFKVSKRGFKVFSTIFYTPTEEEEPPGEVPWSEFLSAMSSVGFSIKKLDGSAWMFVPANDEWRQSILIHEPHPSSKIPFQVARRIGRRLWRRYGWTNENFRRA